MKNLSILTFVILFSLVLNAQTTFAPEVLMEDSNSTVWDVKTGDFDIDGDLDVVTASRSSSRGEVAIYLNNGDGSFGEKQVEDSLKDFWQIAVADFNSDGNLDIAIVGYTFVQWYKGNGDGSFGSPNTISNEVRSATTLYVDDIDGDGNLDVLVGTYSFGKTFWYKNLGDETFSSGNLIYRTEYSVGCGTSSIFLADLDNDGDLDVVPYFCSSGTLWFENDGSGIFDTSHVVIDETYYTNMHVDDMDGDGDVDIIAILATAIVWFENLSNGVFSEEIIITSLVPSQSVFSIYASDLDNDGDKDIIAGAAGFNNFEQVPKTLIIINNGDGTFQAPMIISESHFMAANIHAADIDNDGDNDILSPNANGPLTRGWYFFENLYEGEVINSTINNNNISNQISIFPNPFSHYTTIRFEQPLTSAYDIKIFDSTGKVVRLYQSLKDSEFKIYKNQLSTGVYFLNFYESGQQEILASKKLIVH